MKYVAIDLLYRIKESVESHGVKLERLNDNDEGVATVVRIEKAQTTSKNCLRLNPRNGL